MPDRRGKFVSRAGEKLDAALEAFGVDVAGCVCADFGCNVGGFTDCLLRRGAAKVYAVDTGYGALAWRLRKDPRVVVMERTNALYAPIPEPVDLVAVDVAWTPQKVIVPAAMRWLGWGAQDGQAGRPVCEDAGGDSARPGEAVSPRRPTAGPGRTHLGRGARLTPGGGSIVSLLKPHYELAKIQGRKPAAPLSPLDAREVCLEVCRRLNGLGCIVRSVMQSILHGKGGNVEFLLLIGPPQDFPSSRGLPRKRGPG